MDHAGNGVLSVGRETIVNDALLLGTTCVELVTSVRDDHVSSFRGTVHASCDRQINTAVPIHRVSSSTPIGYAKN